MVRKVLEYVLREWHLLALTVMQLMTWYHLHFVIR